MNNLVNDSIKDSTASRTSRKEISRFGMDGRWTWSASFPFPFTKIEFDPSPSLRSISLILYSSVLQLQNRILIPLKKEINLNPTQACRPIHMYESPCLHIHTTVQQYNYLYYCVDNLALLCMGKKKGERYTDPLLFFQSVTLYFGFSMAR